MLKSLIRLLDYVQNLPIEKRKIILWSVTGFFAVILLFFQISNIKEQTREADFTLFSQSQMESVERSAKEKIARLEERYEEAKEKLGEGVEINEKKIIEEMKKEGLITEEEIEEIINKKEIKREDLKQGELIGLIEEAILIKEKNATEEK